MTTTEKIANAKKRIDELERLIKYWNDSELDKAKIVNFSMKFENKVAQILIIKADQLFAKFKLFNIFDYSNIALSMNRAIKPIFKNGKEEII